MDTIHDPFTRLPKLLSWFGEAASTRSTDMPHERWGYLYGPEFTPEEYRTMIPTSFEAAAIYEALRICDEMQMPPRKEGFGDPHCFGLVNFDDPRLPSWMKNRALVQRFECTNYLYGGYSVSIKPNSTCTIKQIWRGVPVPLDREWERPKQRYERIRNTCAQCPARLSIPTQQGAEQMNRRRYPDHHVSGGQYDVQMPGPKVIDVRQEVHWIHGEIHTHHHRAPEHRHEGAPAEQTIHIEGPQVNVHRGAPQVVHQPASPVTRSWIDRMLGIPAPQQRQAQPQPQAIPHRQEQPMPMLPPAQTMDRGQLQAVPIAQQAAQPQRMALAAPQRSASAPPAPGAPLGLPAPREAPMNAFGAILSGLKRR